MGTNLSFWANLEVGLVRKQEEEEEREKPLAVAPLTLLETNGEEGDGLAICKKGGCGSHYHLNLSGLKHRFLGSGCDRRRRDKCSS